LPSQAGAFDDAVALKLGITPTDLKCLALIRARDVPVNAGQLAQHTGLTTGAITGALDRLERAGLVHREKDAQDRRQVRVRLTADRSHELEALLAPREEALRALCTSMGDAQLSDLLAFLGQTQALLAAQTERTRGLSPALIDATRMACELSAPLGRTRRGALCFEGTPPNLLLGRAPEALLYRLRCDAPAPAIQRRAGKLTMQLARPSQKGTGDVRYALCLELSRALPWSVVLRGGIANLRADLRELSLECLEIDGGVSGAVIELPAPKGLVTLRFLGGAHQLRLARPQLAPVRLHVARGGSDLDLDGLRLAAVGGDIRWESPDFAGAEHAYDISILGGASALSLGTA